MGSASNKEETRSWWPFSSKKEPTKATKPAAPPAKGAEKIAEKVAPSTLNAIQKRRAMLDEI